MQVDTAKVSIDGHEDVPVNDEGALLNAVANQPVSVGIDAGSRDMQFYSQVTEKKHHEKKKNFK